MKNEKTSPFTLRVIEDYNDNKGNPDVTEQGYNTLEQVTTAFKEEMAEMYSENGKTCRVEVMQDGQDEPIFEDSKTSELLPTGSIIVTYKHVTYMNYAYAVVDVRKASEGTRFEDLNVSRDSTGANWDNVYDSVQELQEHYEHSYGIFEKLQSGSSKIEAFLDENEEDN